MIIPNDKIDEVRNANDIVDVISSYIPLSKRGKNYLARCPFHNEKTPSFNVSPDKQMFYCFGCHVGGNVFSFIQQYDKVSFVDAVQKLAERANIQLIVKSELDDKDREVESLYYLNHVVAEYYQKNLSDNSAGKIGLEYFLKRGISEETINKFSLGFSINSWEAFNTFAKDRNLNFQNLEKLGLVNKRNDGSYYDYFHGRIMFPILNISSKVSGFGARKLFEDDNSGKYINSRESPIYNKSKLLYGLSHSKEDIRKNESAILVEGYMDFLTLYQGGFKNVIATSGTSLTIDQLKILSRYTKDILFLYDADMAGVKATVRGLDLILEQGFNVKVVELTEGEDPDSFLKKYGMDKLKHAIDTSVSFIEFISKVYRNSGKLDSAKDRTQATKELIGFISKVKDELKREFYLKEIADKFNLYESIVRDEYERTQKSLKNRRVQSQPSQPITNEKNDKSVIKVANKYENVLPPAVEEEDLIALAILEGKKIIDFVFQYIGEEDILNPLTRDILSFLNLCFSDGKVLSVNEIINKIDDGKIKGFITGLEMNKKIVSKEELKTRYKSERDEEKWIIDVVKLFKIRKINFQIDDIGRRIKQLSPTDSETLNDLLEQHIKLTNEKKEWEVAK